MRSLLLRGLLAMASVCSVVTMTGCSFSAALGGIAAAGGMGGAVSREELDAEPRPPKQVVFRFDDHRYIENDPSAGRVGGCEGEMYYVDEKLGIRTRFGFNKEQNPRGLLKVDSPYVVVRDEQNTFASFDDGRTFVRIGLRGGADIAVAGQDMYAGGGVANGTGNIDRAFDPYFGISLYRLNKENRTIDTIYQSGPKKDFSADSPYVEKAKSLRPTQFFVCKDLPWRPSVKYEREQAKKNKGAQP